MQVILFNFVFYSGVIAILFGGLGVIRAESPQDRKFYLYLTATVFVLGFIALLTVFYLTPYVDM